MKDQAILGRKKLGLGISAVMAVDSILNWKKLESCFATHFFVPKCTKKRVAKKTVKLFCYHLLANLFPSTVVYINSLYIYTVYIHKGVRFCFFTLRTTLLPKRTKRALSINRGDPGDPGVLAILEILQLLEIMEVVAFLKFLEFL